MMPTAILTLIVRRGDARGRRVSFVAVVSVVSGSFSVPVQRSMKVPFEQLSNRRTEEPARNARKPREGGDRERDR
jgi:hypothetical protein